ALHLTALRTESGGASRRAALLAARLLEERLPGRFSGESRLTAALDAPTAEHLGFTAEDLAVLVLDGHRMAGPVLGEVRSRLVQVLDEASEALGFAPALRMEGLIDTDVPPAVADEALAVVGEALTNAARHAEATRAEVSIAAADGKLTVIVTDNGVGLPAGGRRSGLRNLAERAERHGGRMEVSARGDGERGTRLEWQVPLVPPPR
ncbi:sensor histidine kinase, partial [Streptomyces sp. NPDC001193]